jgi:hypothetical protein
MSSARLEDCLPATDWDRRLMRCDSYSRTHELYLAMLSERDPHRQLKLFGDWATVCDAPWHYRSCFAEILRRAIAAVGLVNALDPAEREWFSSLGPEIEVFRGCERGRVRGLHWSTQKAVAEGFPRGKRCRNQNPTLARAIIRKEHVFFLFLRRREHEVVVDPRRLRQVKVIEIEVERESH